MDVAALTVPVTATAPPPELTVSVPADPLFKTPNSTWVSVLPALLKVIAPPVAAVMLVSIVWFEVA